MRLSFVLAVVTTVSSVGCTNDSAEVSARKEFANTLVEKVPECKGWSTGPENTELAVFCTDATIEYFDQRTVPTVAAACGDLKRLGFSTITAYGPRDSGKRWAKRLSENEVCVVATN